MSNANIDDAIMAEFGAEFLGATEDEEFPESGGSVRTYENSKLAIRVLVEVDPDRKATIYTFHRSIPK